MKLIAQLRLTPAPAQSEVLQHTLKTAIAACNYISEIAWTTHQFKQTHLYRLCYRTVRERFGLSAQMAINCLGKISDAYKLERHTRKNMHTIGWSGVRRPAVELESGRIPGLNLDPGGPPDYSLYLWQTRAPHAPDTPGQN